MKNMLHNLDLKSTLMKTLLVFPQKDVIAVKNSTAYCTDGRGRLHNDCETTEKASLQ